MFRESLFDGDISRWNVSKVTDMSTMFCGNRFVEHESPFNGDISRWDVSNVTNMSGMFFYSRFNGDISKWDVSNVLYMKAMFVGSSFQGDISQWDVSKVTDMSYMFRASALKSKGKVPTWYKEPENSEMHPFIKKRNEDDIWFKEKDVLNMLKNPADD